MASQRKIPDVRHETEPEFATEAERERFERARAELQRLIEDGERSLVEEGSVSAEDLQADMDELFDHFRREVAAGRMKP